MTELDVERLRADTPGCERLIHFNNAGAALAPGAVIDAVAEQLRAESACGGYEAADLAKDRLDAVYADIGRLLNCSAAEIALAENASRPWAMAVQALRLGEGDRVLVHDSEYGANIMGLLHLARTRGIVIDRAASTGDGTVDLSDLERRIGSRTRLIAITHIPSHRGLVNPAAEVGRIARRLGLSYMLDAAQSAGQTPIDVGEIGCDLLVATGRKFLRGPRGTGFLYVRNSLVQSLEPPLVDLRTADWSVAAEDYQLHPDARRFESWEFGVAARLGLGAAVRYAVDLGVPAIQARIIALASDLRGRLAEAPGIEVLERGGQQSAIVAFRSDREGAVELVARLRSGGANLSVIWPTAAPYDSAASPAVRASPHAFNTADEIERFCRLVVGG